MPPANSSDADGGLLYRLLLGRRNEKLALQATQTEQRHGDGVS